MKTFKTFCSELIEGLRIPRDAAHSFKNFDDPWKVMNPEDRKEANRLFFKGMKTFSRSPKQKEIQAKLNVILAKYKIGTTTTKPAVHEANAQPPILDEASQKQFGNISFSPFKEGSIMGWKINIQGKGEIGHIDDPRRLYQKTSILPHNIYFNTNIPGEPKLVAQAWGGKSSNSILLAKNNKFHTVDTLSYKRNNLFLVVAGWLKDNHANLFLRRESETLGETLGDDPNYKAIRGITQVDFVLDGNVIMNKIYQTKDKIHQKFIELWLIARKTPDGKTHMGKKPSVRLNGKIINESEHAATPAAADKSNGEMYAEVATHTLKVGDILYTSWGYSMTIVDFFKVTKLLTATKIAVVPLNDDISSGQRGYSGEKVPDMTHQTGQREQIVFIRNNQAKVALKSGVIQTARIWDGKPVYFNHMD